MDGSYRYALPGSSKGRIKNAMSSDDSRAVSESRSAVAVEALRAWKALVRRQPVVLATLLFLGLVGAEIVLRLRPFPPYAADLLFYQAADVSVHRPSDDPGLLIELIPGTRDVYKPEAGVRRNVTVNALGLRDPERAIPKPEGWRRVLVLGSSTTFGAAVRDDETLTAHMEVLLNAGGTAPRWEVVNAGVNAYGPQQMAAMGERLFRAGLDPDVVLFQLFLSGPRAFLKDRPEIEPFRKDSTLAAEYFVMPQGVSERAGGWLVARSRLLLLGLAHYNRMMDPAQRRTRLAEVQKAHHVRALREFVEQHRDVPIAGFVMPCPDESEVSDLLSYRSTVPMTVWCLAPPGEGPDYLDPHPPSPVYRDYARSLLIRMAENGMLAGIDTLSF